MLRRVQVAALVTALTAGVGLPLLPASAADTSGSIYGTVFDDANRNGGPDDGETRFAAHTIQVFDARGQYVTQMATGEDGTYRVNGLAAGSYIVQPAPASWWPLENDWVPTTTSSIRPTREVNVEGATRTDFGWRRIVRSTTAGSPISTYTGGNGLRVESYNDAVSAREIYDTLMSGTVGAEAPYVTVRFDLGATSATSSSVAGSPGSYSNYQSMSHNNWATWLDGPWGLSHEYGHSWSNYYDTIVQQEGGFGSYLKVRGLEGHPRLGESHAWEPGELIAEDYRQLLGPPAARSVAQENRELPAAKDVPGLLEFLSQTFTTPPAGSQATGGGQQEAPQPLQVTAPTVNSAAVSKSASFSSNVSAASRVTVVIRDSRGSHVATLLDGESVPAGTFTTTWDRKTDSGRRAVAGTYTAVVSATDGGQSVSASTAFQVK